MPVTGTTNVRDGSGLAGFCRFEGVGQGGAEELKVTFWAACYADAAVSGSGEGFTHEDAARAQFFEDGIGEVGV